MISLSVCAIPSLARSPTFMIVFSTPFVTIPSPPTNWLPCRYISIPSSPAPTADAILAAQLAFAPSQTIPELIASALTTVCAISLYPPP